MGMSIKNLSATRALSDFVKTIVKLPLNLVKISSSDVLPYKMFTCGMPYEASETYRTIRNEFEHNRSLATIEARQALCRC